MSIKEICYKDVDSVELVQDPERGTVPRDAIKLKAARVEHTFHEFN
jgi:hypothetical protein